MTVLDRSGSRIVSIDFIDNRYIGEQCADEGELCSIAPKDGTAACHRYWTAYVVSNGKPVRLAMTYVRNDEDEADLPDHSTLVKTFDRLETALWRVLLRLSSELHDPSGHGVIDATFFDRETASKHYCRRTNYRVQTLKTTALVDTETHAILDVHCSTDKPHNTQLGWQVARRNTGDFASLAANKGYDWMKLREKLREEGVRPLIKHRILWPIDHARIVPRESYEAGF
jgi:hypothetical protein